MIEPRQPDLGERRHAGQCLDPVRRRDADRAQLAGGDQRPRHRNVGEHQRDMAAGGIIERRGNAAIWHVGHGDAEPLLQQLAVPMPNIPPYDPAKSQRVPWEDAIVAAIEKLRADRDGNEDCRRPRRIPMPGRDLRGVWVLLMRAFAPTFPDRPRDRAASSH